MIGDIEMLGSVVDHRVFRERLSRVIISFYNQGILNEISIAQFFKEVPDPDAFSGFVELSDIFSFRRRRDNGRLTLK